MTGWLIFRHAFLMLIRNFAMALKISVLPLLLFVLAFYLLDQLSAGPKVTDREAIPFDRPVGDLTDIEPEGILSFIVLLAFGLTMAWVAVAWHRYILLNERSALPIPRLNALETGWYLIVGIKLLLLFTIVAIPLLLFIAVFPAIGSVALGGTSVVMTLAVSTLLFLVGTALPAAALGERLKIKDAWLISKDHVGTIVVLVIAMEAFTFIVGTFVGLLGDHFFAGAVGVGLSWFSFFLNLCILTTLYGYLIEKRSLSA